MSSTASKDRKSTRLNSSHLVISYAVFCLKKKERRAHGRSAEIRWGLTPAYPSIALPVALDQSLVYHRQMIEIGPEIVVQPSAPVDRLLHIELGAANQLDGRAEVVHRLIPQLHHGREGPRVLLGIVIDGVLPLPPDGAVAGIEIPHGSHVDHGQ